MTAQDILLSMLNPVNSPDLDERLKQAFLDPRVLAEALERGDNSESIFSRSSEADSETGAPIRTSSPGDDSHEPTFEATSQAHFAADRPQLRHDKLGRGALAFAFAHLMCRISVTQCSESALDDGAFVMHLDAPWGGGKTTFANFVASVG
jgi:hypothetical protein